MRAIEGYEWLNINATPANFSLVGGVYCLDVTASNWGTVTLNRLGPDGFALIATSAAQLSANGTTDAMALPAGIYQLTLSASIAAVYASIARITGE